MTTDPQPVPPIAEELATVERLAVRLHEEFRPLAGDVLIFEDCLEIARLAVGTLRREVATAYDRGLAEGRRQATEGWEREWGTRVGDGPVESHASEHSARRWASGDHGVLVEVVSRLVGPWEPDEQPEGGA